MATMSASISGVSLISRIAARTYLRGLAAAEHGDFDQVLRQFAPRCELIFVSRTALGARLSGRADLLRWFERFGRLLPDRRFEVLRFVAGGPVWDQRIAAHVIIRSQIAGAPYQNQFAHFLTLRWGQRRLGGFGVPGGGQAAARGFPGGGVLEDQIFDDLAPAQRQEVGELVLVRCTGDSAADDHMCGDALVP